MYFINIYYKYFSANFSFLIFFEQLLARNIIPIKLMIKLIVGRHLHIKLVLHKGTDQKVLFLTWPINKKLQKV